MDIRPIPSATCPRESVLPIRLRPDLFVVFEGYAGRAEHRRQRQEARKASLRAEILRTCCLRDFSEFLQGAEEIAFFCMPVEHFDFRGSIRDGTEIELRVPIAD